MSNNFDIPWLKVLEELIKKDKNLSTTTRTTTPATQIEDQMSQLRSSANIEATLMKNRQKMLKKEIYDIAEIIFKEYVLEAQFKPRDLALQLRSNLVKKLDEMNNWKSLYVGALNDLKDVLMEDNRGISSYEYQLVVLYKLFEMYLAIITSLRQLIILRK